MGIYIYKLSNKPKVVTPIGGVHIYTFFEKVAGFRGLEKQGDRIARIWRRFDVSGPVLVAFEKKEGACVYRQERAAAVWYDSSDRGFLVGKLYKEAGKWKIFPLRDESLDSCSV